MIFLVSKYTYITVTKPSPVTLTATGRQKNVEFAPLQAWNFYTEHEKFRVQTRVARWFIFKPKIPNWANF
jgi:hypothetical protein